MRLRHIQLHFLLMLSNSSGFRGMVEVSPLMVTTAFQKDLQTDKDGDNNTSLVVFHYRISALHFNSWSCREESSSSNCGSCINIKLVCGWIYFLWEAHPAPASHYLAACGGWSAARPRHACAHTNVPAKSVGIWSPRERRDAIKAMWPWELTLARLFGSAVPWCRSLSQPLYYWF